MKGTKPRNSGISVRPPVDPILVHNLVLMNPVNHESEVRAAGASAILHAAPIGGVTDRRHAVAGCDVTLAAHTLAA